MSRKVMEEAFPIYLHPTSGKGYNETTPGAPHSAQGARRLAALRAAPIPFPQEAYNVP